MPTVLQYTTRSGLTLRCDARCHDAKHTKCVCICGGALHGVGSFAPALQQAIAAAGKDLVDRIPLLAEDIAETFPSAAIAPHHPDQLRLFPESEP